eukprot:Nk52_evm50s2657 gene=Nk52_evmTU50s2657
MNHKIMRVGIGDITRQREVEMDKMPEPVRAAVPDNLKGVPLVPVGADFRFETPKKTINSPEDMEKWIKCEAYAKLIGFLLAVNESIKGKPISQVKSTTPIIDKLLEMLDDIDALTKKIAPIEQPMRFGNKAFRTWFEEFSQVVSEHSRKICSEFDGDKEGLAGELGTYLLGSFGNSTRIDYGSGHELSFIGFLAGLRLTGLIEDSDYAAIALVVFQRYLEVVRAVLDRYLLEPAGSHGVWGLDDFFFVAFYWGSAQFLGKYMPNSQFVVLSFETNRLLREGHRHLRPKSFVKDEIIEGFSKEYIFLQCIQYIKETKKGHFAETSPYLNDISAVPNWEKVNGGLMKMFKVEVIGKFPVVQHFLMGSLFPFHEA